ncbi:dehydrogenase/reductase SDR family member 12 isoform X2 [Nerophis lumbriciformis]|uniref:dehydrogenase/reductase SDR family member 12 isoform X2 n=1 Tax=Nerophis lumbriciformis TaxID=546530 RepID=UPI002AE05490|nr:dehydrogenase/reductase SDR family member 12-like isoform X2 [Nerophis lumbriciformis]
MSMFRNAVWFVKGLNEYTKSGYEAAAKHFVAADLEVDLSGRSFMITGANSGLGKATAQEIANRGGTVHMVCRNKGRADAAKQEIVERSKNQNIHVHVVDMSCAKHLWDFAQSFVQSNVLNVLINNAGCMVNQREVTEEGLEKNFATNTLEAAGHPDREVGDSAQRHPLVIYAPWLGRHSSRADVHAVLPRQDGEQTSHGGHGCRHHRVAGRVGRRHQAAQRTLLPRSACGGDTPPAGLHRLVLSGGRQACDGASASGTQVQTLKYIIDQRHGWYLFL